LRILSERALPFHPSQSIKVVRCAGCRSVEDLSGLPMGGRRPCGRCGAEVVVPAQGSFPDCRHIVLFLTGTMPEGVDPVTGVVYSIAASLSLAMGSDFAVYDGIPASVVQVDSISDETPVVREALVASVFEGNAPDLILFFTTPIVPLAPPIQSGMICLITSILNRRDGARDPGGPRLDICIQSGPPPAEAKKKGFWSRLFGG
jgi:hypothetical protein